MRGPLTEQPDRQTARRKNLGARLETVAALVHARGPFRCLADIGSDHAFLPIRALTAGDAETAVASDLREGPLEKGKANAEKAGVSPVFRLSDGFQNLDGFSFDAVCICGLGGETIAGILENGKPFVRKPDCVLFLQPMTAHDDLRTYLWEEGFRIAEETFVVEGNKPYVILTAVYGGTPEAFSYADRYLGKIRPDDASFRAYCAKAASQARKRLRAKDRLPEDGELLRTAEELAGKDGARL